MDQDQDEAAKVHRLEVPDPKADAQPPDHGQQVVVIKRPQEVACFSFDDNHQYRPDDSSLRWYHTATPGADLSAGFEDFDKLDDSADEHLTFLLRSLQELEQRQGARVDADFVTWRGMLTTVLTAPYETDPDGYASLSQSGFAKIGYAHALPISMTEMNATLFQGTIFIEQNHAAKMARQTREATRDVDRRQASPALASFWGYKYETLATLPTPWATTTRADIEARPTHRVSNKAQYVSVASSRVGAHSFTLGGEVDALWDAHAPGATYVELKSARVPDARAPADVHARFAARLLRIWAQSFLLGVGRVVVGARTGGARPRLERDVVWETARVPGLARGAWDQRVCVAFLHRWLGWVKGVVCAPGVWRLRFVARPRGEGGRLVRVWEAVRIADGGVGEVVSAEFVAWRTGRDAQMDDGARPETPPSC